MNESAVDEKITKQQMKFFVSVTYLLYISCFFSFVYVLCTHFQN